MYAKYKGQFYEAKVSKNDLWCDVNKNMNRK